LANLAGYLLMMYGLAVHVANVCWQAEASFWRFSLHGTEVATGQQVTLAT